MTLGNPQAIASTSTFGIPSRSPPSTIRHGRQSASARRYSCSSSACDFGPASTTRPASPRSATRRPDRVTVVAVLADDRRLDLDPASLEQGAGVDQDVEPLLLHQPADPEQPQAAVGRAGGSARIEQEREVGVEAVVDAVDVRLRGDAPQVAAVRLGAGDREAGGQQLAAQQPRRVQPLGVDVLRVPGERERQAGDHRREPRHRRAAVREVGVQVAHVGRGEQPVRERHRLEQLLDVDLARPGAARLAGADRLCERRRGRSREPRGPTARDRGDAREERAEVPSQPAREGGARDRVHGREVAGPGADPLDDRMPGALVGLLDHVQATGRPARSRRSISLAMKISDIRG